jgi:uridine kinase
VSGSLVAGVSRLLVAGVSRSLVAGVNRSLVAIDGIDGSGKSRFASTLADACAAEGLPAVIVRVDDFRRPVDFDAVAPEQEAALYYDSYYDFAALDETLATFLSGQAAGESRVAIVEGVFVLRAGLLDGSPLVVLDVTPEQARLRIVTRDQAKGRTIPEIWRRIDRRYFPGQARYRATFDPVGRADVLVDNSDWSHPRVVRSATERFPAPVAAALARCLR